ncbi:MAG: hypothetical protein QXP41_00625 [Candidatus Nitrosocaldus sp.]
MTWFDDNLGDIANQLIRIKMEVDGKYIERDVKPDVIIDYEVLEDQLIETPQAFVYWGFMLAEAKKNVATIERAIAVRRGQVTKTLLEEARKEGVKLRASDIEDLVETDEQLNQLETRLILANRTLSKLFAIVEAVKMKSEHLRSLAGFKKQELKDAEQP